MWTALQTFVDPVAKIYTGVELSPLWIYKTYGLQGSALVAFQGACDVPLAHLVDQADVLANAPIASDHMIHVVAELFGLSPEAGVMLQRLWMARVAEDLNQQRGASNRVIRTGDDLWVSGRKLSVSICTVSALSVLIHIGLNVTTSGTPLPTAGLLSDQLLAPEVLDNLESWQNQLLQNLAEEAQQALLALCKVVVR
jgi:hypothetical protein